MSKLKIALGDLKHRTLGRHSIMMPIGIGYIASYALSKVGSENIDVRLYDDPEKLLTDIKTWKPDVLALSSYCWNTEVSRTAFEFAKRLNPETICIGGGPDFPKDTDECYSYLLERNDVDLFIYLDGELAFSKLIQNICDGVKVEVLKSTPQESTMSIHPKTKKLIDGKVAPRLMDRDEIPSPYLNGLMDQWFTGEFAPMIQMTRGCPFTCSFCVEGESYWTKLAKFSTKRIFDELTYIAKRMKNYPQVMLGICDSNFGMYERDEEIAHHMGKLQDTYGWPNAFDVTTGKANHERILRIIKILKDRMHATMSVQSLNDDTLQFIRRKNISLDKYGDVQSELKKRGQLSVSEMIIPMPGETKETFFEGVKLLLNAGVGRVTPYTTMMLKGTELASQKSRNQFQMKTKWRIIPRQFGEYCGEKTFEVEEVCIQTNTMNFEDYLECRGFALVINTYANEQFDVVRKHLKELNTSPYDYYYDLWVAIRSGNTKLSGIYERFIEETKDELWDSREKLIEHFNQSKNYEKLINGRYGDNLIRKYSTITYIEASIATFDLAYELLFSSISDDELCVQESLEETKKWAVSLRNIGAISKEETYLQESETLNFSYDIKAWYLNNDKPLIDFKGSKSYKIYCGKKQQEILEASKLLYGEEINYRLGRTLNNWSPKDLWRECDTIN